MGFFMSLVWQLPRGIATPGPNYLAAILHDVRQRFPCPLAGVAQAAAIFQVDPVGAVQRNEVAGLVRLVAVRALRQVDGRCVLHRSSMAYLTRGCQEVSQVDFIGSGLTIFLEPVDPSAASRTAVSSSIPETVSATFPVWSTLTPSAIPSP